MRAGKIVQAATLVILSSLLGACCTTECAKNQTAAVVEKEKNLAVMKSSTYYFGFDSAELLPIAQNELDEVAAHLLENTERKIHIEGNTDIRGPAKYNMALGMRRAEAVASYLESKGVSADRISIESLGAQNLADNGTTNEAHAANRRAKVAFEAVDSVTV